jgi:hypothetical protein
VLMSRELTALGIRVQASVSGFLGELRRDTSVS